MIIDILFIICMVFAIFKGYRNGLIVAVFSLVAIIVGLAAAMKLSVFVAERLGEHISVSKSWLPFISFALVMITVVILIRLGAVALQKMAELVLLGWVNKLAGIALYGVLYMLVLSVLLFFAEKLHLLDTNTITASKTYPYIQPWGPKTLDGIGKLIPLFSDMFERLSSFFESAGKAHQAAP
ncbi:MAG: CvpA family protein [Sediminibacterium sp.]|nr:CvpA family protein [uncultured Sediminibacterium sp.]